MPTVIKVLDNAGGTAYLGTATGPVRIIQPDGEPRGTIESGGPGTITIKML